MNTLGTVNKQINPLTIFKNVEIYPRIKTNSENYLKNKLIEFDINYSTEGMTHTLTIRIDKNCFNESEFNCSLSNSCSTLHNYKILNFLLENDKKILKALENYLNKLAWVNSDLPLI